MLTEKEILERAFRALDGLAARPVKSQSEAKITENYTSTRCMPETPVMSVRTPPATSPKADSTSSRTSSKTSEVVTDPTQVPIDAASKVLAQAGVRLIGGVHGVDYAGVWSDLDGPELRAAIAVFHPHGVPVRYLDGDVPMRYKLRRVPGEPVPANVLAAMEQEPNQPWVVRDQMLKAMNWTPDAIPWAQYQAEMLNRLFAEQGVTGQPGKIRPETVLHGERGRK